MKECIISFIGGGNMARCLIGGLIANGFPANKIRVADPNSETLNSLAAGYSVNIYQDNVAAIKDADVVVLAVKPQQMQSVVRSLGTHWKPECLLISIAAGIRLNAISRWLAHADAAIVRTMPNTPSLVQAGATALFANSHTRHDQRELAEGIMRAVGLAIWLDDEQHMDAVTALSGSGPAYFFLVMEAMESAAKRLGLDENTARMLCLETAFGAAKMALESGDNAATLRQKVTSPGGTTERAIHELQDGGLTGLFENAMVAAALRSRELADQLGQDHEQ
ncbi:Pyrroline-5-carboxylate reductase [Methylophaga lonarensis MPL]|uniref:Pyrroline-5-carboxylate reductase n=1 Tax=Methylophaga lonarensis MPL TaxID=1286106 RepID=M7NWJ9_9GAMM|nr:pyrroline-5-carboxylate reductase [Methylophaga lonarensis]EMR13148.1 Pyrroline-5-carboxylate reductase [Methylophaga lonarensis MPL]